MKLTFCGAAKIVTGSCYLLEIGKDKLLVDCGMFQGTKDITRKNYEPFLFNPKQIKYVFLTHAHIDHSGLIPKLVKQGFKGEIITTSATIDLCTIMLEDSGNIQEKDVARENRRRKKQGLNPRNPLYTVKDAKASFKFFKKIKYDEKVRFTKNIEVRYRDAGHIIGSAIIEMYITENNKTKKIVFSGDLGQWDVPIVKNPSLIEEADYVLIESTYGDRLHEPIGDRDNLLLKYAKTTFQRGGKLIIPSFAIERTQELLYSFNKLIKSGKFPKEKIFLDSPLAIKATEVFKKHQYLFDEEAMKKYRNPFSFSNLIYTLTTKESIKINAFTRPAVIIAGSGMCNGGRIRHHLSHNINNPKNTILFVGYQAKGTLGRYILRGEKEVRMMGRTFEVNAEIEKINAFSAHADYKELIRWIKGFLKKPKKVYIVHGEEKSSKAFQQKLRKLGYNTHVPEIGEKLEL